MKKILSLLLTLTLVFVLVACSSEKDTSSEGDTSTPTQTESTDTTDTQASETNTNESSSDIEIPSNSTSTPTTNTNKPNTSNKPSTTSSTPTTSKPTETSKPVETDKTNLINQENIKHEQKITELQNRKQSTASYYDNLIDRMGGTSYLSYNVDTVRKSELSRKIFDLKMQIEELKKDTSQKALQKRSQKEKELEAANKEYDEILSLEAKINEIKRLTNEKKSEIAKIDELISEENNLHSQNLEKLK